MNVYASERDAEMCIHLCTDNKRIFMCSEKSLFRFVYISTKKPRVKKLTSTFN